MALDGGADGIVVPYVETVAQVRAMVGAVRYRPMKGRMLDEILKGTRQPSAKMVDFFAEHNRQKCLIIGIESVPAYENLDALIGMDGVDGVFVGPHDMTLSLGIPGEYESPEFMRVARDIAQRSRAAGIGCGVHLSQVAVGDDRFNELLEAGMNWVLYGADVALLRAEMPARLDAFRKRFGDSYIPGAGSTADGSCIGGKPK